MNAPRCFLLLLVGTFISACSLRADEEQDLIRVLESNAGPTQKSDACKRLRLSGSARAVPAIAPLLLDVRTSQAARYALEGIAGPEADAALRGALPASAGLVKAGLADSLGWRHDAMAVPLLGPLLTDSDEAVAAASATALGRIATPEALVALRGARNQAAAAVKFAVTEALLRCADARLARGDGSGARAVYQALLAPEEPEQVRVAAHLGLMRTAEDGGFALIISALGGEDGAAQTAALAQAGSLQHPEAAQAFAARLPKASPALQVALIALLQVRGDAAAVPAVLAAARSPEPTVRTAAVTALGLLGGASVVPALAEAATSRDAAEQVAARQALVSLRGPGMAAALVAALASAAPGVQLELVRALTVRGEATAIPALLELARSDTGAGRSAALQALGSLADGRHVQPLVDLLTSAQTDVARDEVRGVFERFVQRADVRGQLDVGPLVSAMTRGDLATRQALLRVGVLFVDERTREAVRGALKDPDERIRASAARALCDARDPALLPDLMWVARETKDPALRSLALDGGVRLATEDGTGLADEFRLKTLTAAFELAERAQDKRMVLAGLAQLPNRTTLALAERAVGDPDVRAEAEQAALQIAGKLGAAEFDAVKPVLMRLAATAGSAAVREKAQGVLQALDSGWLYAGPYRQAGKECQELFDLAFPPEQPNAGEANWQRAPGSTDPARAGEVDFSNIVGGNHAVVYAKRQVHASQAQPVIFSLGSDDGIKLWVNGELVHANNAVRGLTPDQDRAKGRLHEGWNDLLVKITQHTVGCGFTLRVLSESGQPAPVVRFAE